MTWLIVGLGNPGTQYAKHRHNIGFMVVDELSRMAGASWQTKFRSHWGKGSLTGQDVAFLKPQTYMNLSGTSVGEAASFFKTPPSEVLVIHDELDLAFRDVRVKIGGGHAGHNGLRSIFEHFGKDFVRVRCGIGKPKFGDTASWVLSDFKGDEAVEVPLLIEQAVKATLVVLEKGALAAQNTTNAKPAAPKPPKPAKTPNAKTPPDPNEP